MKKITNARFTQINQFPQIESQLTAKLYVANAIDEPSLIRLDLNDKLKLDEQDTIILNSTLTSPETMNKLLTKAYIDSIHGENERNRKDLGMSFYDEVVDLVEIQSKY